MTGGLATGGLAYAAEVGAEVIQVFVSNPRGWAAGPGDAGQDRVLRDCGMPVFIHAPYLIKAAMLDELVAAAGDVPIVVDTPGDKAGHARDIATLKGLRAA